MPSRSFPIPSSRKFGNYIITFAQGGKGDDDYVIKINDKQIDDHHIFRYLHGHTPDKDSAKNILKFIWQIGERKKIGKENAVYTEIRNSFYPDELKGILFAIWHRLIIDDINYPIDEGLNGRKRLLGQIYILLAKKFGFNLPDYILSLPEEVFRLGFPQKLTENVSTSQWNEIYEMYKKFYKGDKNA
ncbi:hypothetical protein J7K43_05410 [Candidatus Calescamantes bacterium]|nr:hypothetical protein [Candidatus Calescamantes bacterium]